MSPGLGVRDPGSTPGSATNQSPGLRKAIPSLRICEPRGLLGLISSKCLNFSDKKLRVKNGIQEL